MLKIKRTRLEDSILADLAGINGYTVSGTPSDGDSLIFNGSEFGYGPAGGLSTQTFTDITTLTYNPSFPEFDAIIDFGSSIPVEQQQYDGFNGLSLRTTGLYTGYVFLDQEGSVKIGSSSNDGLVFTGLKFDQSVITFQSSIPNSPGIICNSDPAEFVDQSLVTKEFVENHTVRVRRGTFTGTPDPSGYMFLTYGFTIPSEVGTNYSLTFTNVNNEDLLLHAVIHTKYASSSRVVVFNSNIPYSSPVTFDWIIAY